MAYALTSEQVDQIVNNTMLVLMVRPDLMSEWRTNLQNLLQQTQQYEMDDEAIFVAAVLTALHKPADTLPTGTIYDYAWQSIVVGLQTGVARPAASEAESLSLDRLLNSVAEALITVMTEYPEQKDAVVSELREMRTAAADAKIDELIAWIDDGLALLQGTPAAGLGQQHQGVYATYWEAVIQNIEERS
jgi:hypothetical protein